MFIDNKYTSLYHKIINNRKQNEFNGYTEKHHIIPKSLGGTNKKENLVKLSAREHFICHRLLVKMTVGQNKVKMSYAIRTMMIRENQYQERYKISSKIYESIKKETKSIIGSNMIGINNPFYGKTHSVETSQKMKEKRALQVPPLLGKNFHHTEETKEKLRLANKKQFTDLAQIEMRRVSTREQMKDPDRRCAAGNGKRGKAWYHCPKTKKCSTFFPNDVPAGYIKGRIIKK